MLDLGISEWLNEKVTGNTPTTGHDNVFYNNVKKPNLVDSRPGATQNGSVYSPTQPTSSSNSSGGSKSSGGSGGSSSGSSSMEKDLNKSKNSAEDALEARKKAYGKLYGQLTSNLQAMRGDVNTQRDNALTAMDSDYENALTRSNSTKESMGEYYDGQEKDLSKSYEDQRKERERMFQARNITNSSYYIDAVTEADSKFNETLSSLGKDEARNILEVDTQIKELETERMTKRSDIETAYNQSMRQIEADITKTAVEKADAMDRLNGEYESKIGTINQQLLSIQQQQQAYREKVSASNFDTGYQNTQYGIDLNNQDLMMKTPAAQAQLLKALESTKGADGYVNPDEYARLRSLITGSPTTFDNKYGTYVNPKDAPKLGLTAPKASTTANTSDLFDNL